MSNTKRLRTDGQIQIQTLTSYTTPLPITSWKMVPKGKDHFVISLISGILRFPCLFASGNHILLTTFTTSYQLQIDFTEYFLDFVFDDKVAILENGDIWDTESPFANIFTSHDFWGKLYLLKVCTENKSFEYMFQVTILLHQKATNHIDLLQVSIY